MSISLSPSATLSQRSGVNIFHQESATKVDLFVAGGSPLDETQIWRRMRVRVTTNPDRHLYVHTPEDILLQKLRWFRLGNEASDRQWRDILGIILVQGEALERDYLANSAERLGVSDLLIRAFDDATGR